MAKHPHHARNNPGPHPVDQQTQLANAAYNAPPKSHDVTLSVDDVTLHVEKALRLERAQAAEDRRAVQHLATRVEEILSRELDIIRRVDDAVSKLHRGISDVNSALKQATAILANAQSAAALEERMNESEVATKALIADLALSLGKARDQLRVLDNGFNSLRGDVDSNSQHLREVSIETGSNSRMLSSNHPLTRGVPSPGAGVVTVE